MIMQQNRYSLLVTTVPFHDMRTQSVGIFSNWPKTWVPVHRCLKIPLNPSWCLNMKMCSIHCTCNRPLIISLKKMLVNFQSPSICRTTWFTRNSLRTLVRVACANCVKKMAAHSMCVFVNIRMRCVVSIYRPGIQYAMPAWIQWCRFQRKLKPNIINASTAPAKRYSNQCHRSAITIWNISNAKCIFAISAPRATTPFVLWELMNVAMSTNEAKENFMTQFNSIWIYHLFDKSISFHYIYCCCIFLSFLNLFDICISFKFIYYSLFIDYIYWRQRIWFFCFVAAIVKSNVFFLNQLK